jgi:hypothetical protein
MPPQVGVPPMKTEALVGSIAVAGRWPPSEKDSAALPKTQDCDSLEHAPSVLRGLPVSMTLGRNQIVPMNLAQRVDRLKVRIQELACCRERDHRETGGCRIEGSPIKFGEFLPHLNAAVHFSELAQVSDLCPIAEARLSLDLRGESLLSLIYPNGDTQRFGRNPYHAGFPLNGRRLTLATETMRRLPFGEPVREPKLSMGFSDAAREHAAAVLAITEENIKEMSS